jgi:hypothetical protein
MKEKYLKPNFKIVLPILVLASLTMISYAKEYSEDIAIKAVYYSGSTYCSKDSLTSWTCGEACFNLPGVESITKLEDLSRAIFGMVLYNSQENEIAVTFRGTNGVTEIKNWGVNLQFSLTPYRNVTGALVHLGWYSAYEAV